MAGICLSRDECDEMARLFGDHLASQGIDCEVTVEDYECDPRLRIKLYTCDVNRGRCAVDRAQTETGIDLPQTIQYL
jgi:hypothetical protein